MGFVVRARTFKLVFEDPDLEGLEVRATSTSLAEILEFMDLAEMPREQLLDGKESQRVRGMMSKFIDNVTSWNLKRPAIDEKGKDIVPEIIEDVPLTLAGLLSVKHPGLPVDMAMTWLNAVVSFNAPLGRKSNDGAASLEGSLQMEVL